MKKVKYKMRSYCKVVGEIRVSLWYLGQEEYYIGRRMLYSKGRRF